MSSTFLKVESVPLPGTKSEHSAIIKDSSLNKASIQTPPVILRVLASS